MPARSRKQQRYLYAKFGQAWVQRHHYDRLAPKAKSEVARDLAARRRGK